MKNTIALLCVISFCVASAEAAAASRASHTSRLGAGVRYHPGQDTAVAAPFDNDISYGLLYEYREGDTFWQLGVNYADSMGTNEVDYVITPEINLIFADKIWRGGAGILSSYVNGVTASDWSDIYFQFILGIEIPVGKMSLEILAYYVFDDFDGLKEFDFNEIDVGAWLIYKF